jgi:hypothetical protein
LMMEIQSINESILFCIKIIYMTSETLLTKCAGCLRSNYEINHKLNGGRKNCAIWKRSTSSSLLSSDHNIEESSSLLMMQITQCTFVPSFFISPK